MKRFLCVAALVLPLTAIADSPDAAFYVEAAQGGMAEVELGKLASTKATKADVKAFGAKMVADHSKAGEQLKGTAAKAGVTLPSAPNAEQMATKKRLEGLSGAAFDSAYLETQVADHDKTAALLQKEMSMGKDAAAKEWATQTLPTVKMHRSMLDKLKGASAEHAAH